LGLDYLAHAFLGVPLLPEQVGYLLVKVLPLSVFENLLKALGVLARPLLLVGATAGARRTGSEAYQLCLTVLEQCELLGLANRRAESLGLLHRKRLELARALATDPAVLLLDEIGGGLTDAEAGELIATIEGLRQRGIAIVWIEHVVHVLLQVVSRLVCMSAGRVIADGEPRLVISHAAVIDAYLGSRA
jgi:branched-chain amino acid transport system ATP-binding protein